MLIKDFFISIWFASRQIIRSNKKSLVLTIIVMSLLFVNLLFISSMLLGVVETINHQIIDTQYGNIIVEPSGKDKYIKGVHEKEKIIAAQDQVTGVSSRFKVNALMTFDKEKTNEDVKSGSWTVVAVDPKEERNVTIIDKYLVAGRYLQEDDVDKIVIGREISGGFGATFEMKSLKGVNVGDKIDVQLPGTSPHQYTVVGIFATKNFLADANAYIHKRNLGSSSIQDLVTEIIIKLKSTGEEAQVIRRLQTLLGDDLQIKSWNDYAGVIASTRASFDLIRLIFYGIGLAVAGTSIFIIIYINCVNQKKQIGILKAIGMKSNIIIASYIIQAIFYAVIGIIIGTSIVEFILLPYFTQHPFNFPIGYVSLYVADSDLIKTSISLVIVAIVGGLIPSWEINRNNILDIIWG